MENETKVSEVQIHMSKKFRSFQNVSLCRTALSLRMRKPHTIVDRAVTAWTSEKGVFLLLFFFYFLFLVETEKRATHCYIFGFIASNKMYTLCTLNCTRRNPTLSVTDNKVTLEIVLNTIFQFLFIVVSFNLFLSNILIYYKVQFMHLNLLTT